MVDEGDDDDLTPVIPTGVSTPFMTYPLPELPPPKKRPMMPLFHLDTAIVDLDDDLDVDGSDGVDLDDEDDDEPTLEEELATHEPQKEEPAMTEAKPMTKTEAVRQGMAALGSDTPLKELCDWILENHGLEVSEKAASSYRSLIMARASTAGEKTTSTPSVPPVTPAAFRRSTTAASKGKKPGRSITLEEIRALKNLADRVGRKRVIALLVAMCS